MSIPLSPAFGWEALPAQGSRLWLCSVLQSCASLFRVLTILAYKGDFIPPIPAGRFRVTQSSQDPYCTALHGLSLDTLQGRLTDIDK